MTLANLGCRPCRSWRDRAMSQRYEKANFPSSLTLLSARVSSATTGDPNPYIVKRMQWSRRWLPVSHACPTVDPGCWLPYGPPRLRYSKSKAEAMVQHVRTFLPRLCEARGIVSVLSGDNPVPTLLDFVDINRAMTNAPFS